MAVPSSGQLRLRADIYTEVNSAPNSGNNISLHSNAITAEFSTPDAMSEFYGYSAVVAPTVSTVSATSVGNYSFTARGSCSAVAGGVDSRGFKYTSGNQSASWLASNGSTRTSGSGTGSFSSSITGLNHTTQYSYIAYAGNAAGTTYATNRLYATTTTPLQPPTINSVDGFSGTYCFTQVGGTYSDFGFPTPAGASVSATSRYGGSLSYYWAAFGGTQLTSGQSTTNAQFTYNSYNQGFTVYVSESGGSTASSTRSLGGTGCKLYYMYISNSAPNLNEGGGLWAWGNPAIFHQIYTQNSFTFGPFVETNCPHGGFTNNNGLTINVSPGTMIVSYTNANGDDWDFAFTNNSGFSPNANNSNTVYVSGPGPVC